VLGRVFYFANNRQFWVLFQKSESNSCWFHCWGGYLILLIITSSGFSFKNQNQTTFGFSYFRSLKEPVGVLKQVVIFYFEKFWYI
jgi:hypothetical protein